MLYTNEQFLSLKESLTVSLKDKASFLTSKIPRYTDSEKKND
jgi:hypothetical protein